MKLTLLVLVLFLVTFGESSSCGNNVNCRDQEGRLFMKNIMCKNLRMNHCITKHNITDSCTTKEYDCTALLETVDVSFYNNFKRMCTGYDS